MRIRVLQVLFANVDQLLICLKLDIFIRKIVCVQNVDETLFF